jgi:hypothetical protein
VVARGLLCASGRYCHGQAMRGVLTRRVPIELHGCNFGSAWRALPGNTCLTQRLTSSRNTRPARPVRGRPWKTDGAHRPSRGTIPVRYASVDTATRRPATRQDDTRRHREETARIAENPQLAGRFPRVWQVLGSNQRRLSRRGLHVSVRTSLTFGSEISGRDGGPGPGWAGSRASWVSFCCSGLLPGV